MSEPREVELKLEIGRRQLGRLKRHGLVQLGDPRAQEHLRSVYFDTPDQRLRRKGLTLRVRSANGGYVQTVKDAGEGPGIGLFGRSEWETNVSTPEPDLEAAAETPLRKLLSEEEGGGLQALFTTEIHRTTWLVETGGTEIEVALDEGVVGANGATRELAELELELKRGDPAELFALARKLDGAGGLKLGILTKSERGYQAVAGGEEAFHKADRVKLGRDVPVADAFAAVVRACIRHFRLNEAGVAEGRAPEALHQLRVSVRRLRSAFSLFSSLLDDPESRSLRVRLKALSDRLGDARNLDVFLEKLDHAPDGDAMADPAWVAGLRAEREKAYDEIARALAAKRFRGLMLDLLAWAENGRWRNPEDPEARPRVDRPIAALAAKIMRKRRRRLRKRARDIAALTPEARHEVRIEAKKLRYAAEFFAGLVEGKAEKKRFKAFLASLEALQEALGELNDLETAKTLQVAPMASAGEPPPEAEEDEIADALLARATEAGHAFRDAKPFWRDFA